MRKWLRTKFFQILGRAFATDDGRDILVDALRGQLGHEPQLSSDSESPFPDVVFGTGEDHASSDPIFITGRFRSGSTLLWNIFRHTPGCTSYYEPLNERRWFDPSAR